MIDEHRRDLLMLLPSKILESCFRSDLSSSIKLSSCKLELSRDDGIFGKERLLVYGCRWALDDPFGVDKNSLSCSTESVLPLFESMILPAYLDCPVNCNGSVF